VEDFATVLRIARAIRRVSQRDVAQAAHIDPTRYWKIESGFILARPDEVERLMRVLDLPIREQLPVILTESIQPPSRGSNDA
jgi:transcriptional regulator with XRE-family HTH domain